MEEIKKTQEDNIANILARGNNIKELDRRTQDIGVYAAQVRKKSTDAKRNVANENAQCCGCVPLKAGLTGLMYGYTASLCLLLLFDLGNIFGSAAFLGCITLGIHLTFCAIAPLFWKFKNNDC